MGDTTIRHRAVDEIPRCTEIRIDGPLTSQELTKLEASAKESLDRRDLFVILDLRDVGFVHGAAFARLVDWAVELERQGGGIVFVEIQPKVRVLLENLGIAGFFRLEATEEAGRAHAAARIRKTLDAPRLVILQASLERLEFPITDGAVRIGADPKSTIRVSHRDVEPHHAEVLRADDRCVVRDLGTKSGTYVGDRRITEATLQPGDVIRVGHARLMFLPGAQSTIARASSPESHQG